MDPWFVLQSRPTCQAVALASVANATGARAWAPRKRERVVLPRLGLSVVERWLFGSYLFTDAALEDASVWHAVAKCQGVARVLGGLAPWRLREGVVEELQSRLDDDGFLTGEEAERALMRFAVGDEARVVEGPFVGNVGRVAEVRFDAVLILLALLGRENGVWVDQGQLWLTPKDDAPAEPAEAARAARRYDKVVRGRFWNRNHG